MINLKTGKISGNGNGRGGRRPNQPRRNGGNQIRGLRGNQYALHECLAKGTIDYAEAVVSPFNLKGIGAVRPDKRKTTLGATDRLDALLPISTMAPAFDASNSNDAKFAGFMMCFVPRSVTAEWLNGYSAVDVDGNILMTPDIKIVGLNANFVPIANGDPTVFGEPYAILLTILGDDGLFYHINKPGLGIPDYGDGINFIQTTRMESIRQNFDTIRIVGAAMKFWANEAPINTGGRINTGHFRNSDLVDIIGGESVSSLQIESVLKSKKMFVGLDGTTMRYDPLQDDIQTDFTSSKTLFTALISSDADSALTSYICEANSPFKDLDLAGPNTPIPTVIWRFNDSPYDISVRTVVHIEGATDGQCPFEASGGSPDPNLQHLDHFLRAPRFALSVKGHSFKTFMEHAKRIVAAGAKGLGNAARIMQLLDKFASAL